MTNNKPKQPSPQKKLRSQTGAKANGLIETVWPRVQKLPKAVQFGVPIAVVVVFIVVKAAITPIDQPNAQTTPSQPVVSQPQVSTPVEAPPTPAPESNSAASIDYVGPQGDVAAAIATELPLYSKTSDDLKELGRQVMMSQADFDAATTAFRSSAAQADPFLSYSVRLPKDWVLTTEIPVQSDALSDRLISGVSTYVSPSQDAVRSSFRVRAQKLSYMMTARDWTYQYTLSNHYTIQAVSDYGADRSESIYILNEKDISYVVRMAVLINGPRVVVGEYFVPLDKYDSEKDVQTWGVASFYLTTKDSSPGETVKELPFFNIAQLSYPKSWFLQNPNISAIDLMSASLINTDADQGAGATTLLGRIDVVIVADDKNYTDASVTEYINALYAPSGIRIGDPIGRFAAVANTNGLSSTRFDVRGANNMTGTYQDYQYWLAVYKANGYYYYIGLFTPSRGTDTKNWSRNFGAFEYIIRSIKSAGINN